MGKELLWRWHRAKTSVLASRVRGQGEGRKAALYTTYGHRGFMIQTGQGHRNKVRKLPMN